MTSIPPSQWPGPRLLVPITLDALVIGIPNQNQTWVDLSVNYGQLQRGGSTSSQPFTAGNPLPTGVHLMWTLPWGLRQGQTTDSGDVDFPLVPNRWAVLRSYVARPGATPQLTAWVLQSDFLGPSPQGTNVYPDPTDSSKVKFIGSRYDFSSWRDPGTPQPFLQSIGPGDIAYAAAYANLGNVFGFHDALSDQAPGTYSYRVCGWYSPTSGDPLLAATQDSPMGWSTGSEWQGLMTALGWQVGDGSAQALQDAQRAWQDWQQAHPISGPSINPAQLQLPAQQLCHGTVFGIGWQGSGHFYPQNIPGSTGSGGVQVAVGNNPSEALSAWLAQVVGDPQAERLLEAFQQNMIFQFTEDPVKLETLIHRDEFGSSHGGGAWRVVRADQQDPTQGKAAADQSMRLDDSLTQLLTALNAAQSTLDVQRRVLGSQQWELFSAWYKLQNVGGADPKLKKQLQAFIQQLGQDIQATQGAISQAQAARDTAKAQLEQALDATQVLQPFDLPGYQQPADPVVLVAGTQLDDKLSRPGTFDGDSILGTRFTGQWVDGLEITFGSSTAAVTAAVVQAALTLPTTSGEVPRELPDLWSELLLLDPSASGFLATLFFQQAGISNPTASQLEQVTTLITQQQTAIWNAALEPTLDLEALADAVGVQGTPPQQLSFQAWSQPWTPLYLDWQVEWHPSGTSPADMLSQWQLGEIDFQWTGGSIPAASQLYQGRTLLNLQAVRGLQQQLETFVDTSPNLDKLPDYQVRELRAIISQLGSFDIVTQDLTGFTQQLLMRQVAITGPVTESSVAAAVGDVSKDVPAWLLPFSPLRAGHFIIKKLWVVDAYGQRLPASPDGTNVVPIRAEPVTTPGDSTQAYVQLPPRYAQPTRLDFALLQADDDRIRSNSSDQTSPVAGYVLPNYLDGGLVVFGPSGDNLGAVQPVLRDTGAGVRWDAAPGSSDPLGAAPNIPNAHVTSMVDGLLKAGLGGVDALGALLSVMDTVQWATDPLGQQEEGNLEALVGRPLAVVRASVAMQLLGNPAYDQSLAATGKEVTQGFTAVPFPVRIGDLGFNENGVVGFFVNDDYSRFYTVYGYSALTDRLQASLRGSPEGLRSAARKLAASLAARPSPDAGSSYLLQDGLLQLPADGKTVVYLTLLMSPRGSIPAISGALPVQSLTLSPGPTTEALRKMEVTFRAGPLLTDPKQLRMPLPAEVRGQWSWVRREDITLWRDDESIVEDDPVARIVQRPLSLNQGWLKLNGAFQLPPPKR
ncbi:hypothetical protein COCOR_06896 [Corallococcus coralloides DSM 2259]|uniref:Uncharacterized protein n=1 Tax=Corallococcus coralloides (strain ATCC 25202 / DSM 2259 / NBRC 100086 / M2) TaxID=1144275 RepID=H8N2A0_CORCM|nr:FliJ family protein [Corallococcus coralloides]AFE07205.1 hypothetical protein COCOR_06896 [Corallococcus coralloides DSM 2259]